MIQKETRMYPKAICAAFGRVFYGAQGRVYFSQVIIDNFESVGRCYQRNDPIHEDMPDVLDNDGGEIQIPEAGNCIHLEAFKSGVLVFCDNGIWFLKGTSDSGFTATTYIVDKISHVVLHAKRSVVPVKNDVMFMTSSGLYTIQEPQTGMVTVTKISELRIDSFLESFITPDVHGVFDEANDKVHFSQPEVGGRTLVFDLKLNAFFPWKLSGSAYRILGSLYDEKTQVLYYCVSSFISPNTVVGFYKQGVGTVDLGSFTYSSYIQTQENTVQQYNKNKGVPLIEVYMRRSEQFVLGLSGNEYTYDKPGACLLSTEFDFTPFNPNITLRNVYRPLPYGFMPDQFPYDLSAKSRVVKYTDKIRGVGKSVRFRFQSQQNKEMDLLGFSVQYSLKSR